MTNPLRGVLTALATPIEADEQISIANLHQLVDRSIDAGVHGVVAGGSTGEFASLSPDERIFLTEAVVAHVNGRVPVVAQTGATTTAEAIRQSRAAEQSGADVLMIVTPYYEQLSKQETITYLRDVVESTELPVMLYNIPAATGVNLDPDTIGALADEYEHILYVKDSSADWAQGLQLIHHLGDRIGTFIGWDVYLYSALAEGAAGVMAGTANVVPEQIVSVFNEIDNGNLELAFAQWKRLYPVIDEMISGDFIPAVKAGLEMQGITAGDPRRPMAPLEDEARARLQMALDLLQC